MQPYSLLPKKTKRNELSTVLLGSFLWPRGDFSAFFEKVRTFWIGLRSMWLDIHPCNTVKQKLVRDEVKFEGNNHILSTLGRLNKKNS